MTCLEKEKCLKVVGFTNSFIQFCNSTCNPQYPSKWYFLLIIWLFIHITSITKITVHDSKWRANKNLEKCVIHDEDILEAFSCRKSQQLKASSWRRMQWGHTNKKHESFPTRKFVFKKTWEYFTRVQAKRTDSVHRETRQSCKFSELVSGVVHNDTLFSSDRAHCAPHSLEI